jgi:DNA-binding CsgD family transcriptional regulator
MYPRKRILMSTSESYWDERGWDMALNATPDVVSIHDAEYRIVKVNAALSKVLKKAPKEILGRKCYEIFHGTLEPPSHCPHARAIRDGAPLQEDFFEPYLGVRLLVSVAPIFGNSRRLIGTIHIVRGLSDAVGSPKPFETSSTWAPSERQKQILQLFCSGLVTKEIAFQLKISPRTVEYHKHRMIKHVRARSLPELIAHVLSRGLLAIE